MDMEKWARVRQKVLIDGQSKRSVMSEEGIHWETLQKMLKHPQPPGYQQTAPRTERKIDPHVEWIQTVLEADREVSRKQRHTAVRIFDRLKNERGYSGGYTAVKETVAELKTMKREVFVPLIHRPGEAQVDFGHALVKLGGVLMKCPFFVMSLPYSGSFYVQVFERECTETFWEGHVRAFDFFGAVPTRISYDNSKIAVAKMLKGRDRRLTDGFLQLQSHYLFEPHFCLAARGNEKGAVERMVGYSRANFLVPVPEVETLDALNEHLGDSCRRDLKRQLRGKQKRKEELLAEELGKMTALPATPFESCRIEATKASSLSLVRFADNDYSVPVKWAHQDVVVKGNCQTVRIFRNHEEVCEHRRVWEKEKVVFDPVHYLALLEKKPGAIDFARPLEGWNLPECFDRLRSLMELRDQDDGTREYIGVLRLLETHSIKRLSKAIETALDFDCPRRELIEQHLYSVERGSDVLNLEGRHEHLKAIDVKATRPGDYTQLLQGQGKGTAA